MNWLWIIVWTYAVFVAHSGFARDLAICGCTPNLVLAGLVLMTVRTGGRQGLFLAAGWGLLLDGLGEGRLGVNFVALSLAALAVQQVQARWPSNADWRLGLLASVVVAIEFVASTSLRMLVGGQSPDLRLIVVHAAGTAVYSGVVVAALSFAAQMVSRQPAESSEAAAPTVSNKWRMLTE